MASHRRIPKLVFTGGPCGGKSTIIAILVQVLQEIGIQAFIVPEAATELLTSGFSVGEQGIPALSFQHNIMHYIKMREQFYERLAQVHPTTKQKVLLCDRGLMDSAAYVSDEDFSCIVSDFGQPLMHIRDKEYHGIIHLETAAKGAEQFYTISNNAARMETPEQARALDDRIIRAWTGHPHLKIIANGPGGFEQKKKDAVAAVCNLLGIPTPLEIENKYQVFDFDINNIPVHYQAIEIVQHYLYSTDGESRVRRRSQDGAHLYFHTIKKEVRQGVREEIEHQISGQEYRELLLNADFRYKPIRKTRFCFAWEGQYFELDVFHSLPTSLVLLEIELTQKDQWVKTPPFLKLTDVTGDPQFSNRQLARL